jgi:hypothetical protein
MLPARPLFLTLCLGFSCALALNLPAAPRKSPPPAPSPAPAAPAAAAPTPSWISRISPWKRAKATPPPATPPTPPIPSPAPKPAKTTKASKTSHKPIAPPTPEPIAAPPPSPSWIARLTPWKRNKTSPDPIAAPPASPSWIARLTPWKRNKTSPEPIATPPDSPSWIARLTPWKRDKTSPEPIAAPPPSPSWIARLTPWKRPATTPPAPSQPSADSPKPSLLSGPLAAIRKLRADPSESLPAPDKIERPKDWQDRFIVADPKTALYEFGPSQPGGPDNFLPPGTVVTEVSRKRGWSLIEANGRSGYVDSQSLRQAERADFSDPPPPPAPKPMMATSRTGTSVPWRPAAPPPDLPDEAPMMDLDGALDLLPPLINAP